MHILQVINIILVTILTFFCTVIYGKCGNPHLLHPCICLTNKSMLLCEDLYNEKDLKSVIKVIKGFGLERIEFSSIAMRYIPEDAFQGLSIKFLAIRNSSLLALSETTRAFSGLERSLKSLVVEDCPFASAWEWSQLASLTKLEELEILGSQLLELGPDFLTLSKLPFLRLQFIATNIQVITRNAFSSFKYLNKVSLDKNALTEVQRTLFPRPAKYLSSIGFGHNRLQFIPDDMFIDMPALKFLYLGANPLYILNEKTFQPIWKQLDLFVFHDTNLVCDCRLQWLTEMEKKTQLVVAKCANPFRLKGRKIMTLETDELWCSTLSDPNMLL